MSRGSRNEMSTGDPDKSTFGQKVDLLLILYNKTTLYGCSAHHVPSTTLTTGNMMSAASQRTVLRTGGFKFPRHRCVLVLACRVLPPVCIYCFKLRFKVQICHPTSSCCILHELQFISLFLISKN